MKTRKLLAILLCLVMLLTITAACSTVAPSASPSASAPSTAPESSKPPVNPDAPKKDTLNIAVDSDAGTLNPGFMPASGFYNAMEAVYEPLWDYSETKGMIPVLMESYDVVAPDHWVIHLRKDVKFSNGNPFNADDVIASLAYWKTVGSQAVRVQSLDEKRTAKIDDYTIDLYTPAPFYLFNETAASMFLIFDKESFDAKAAATKPIGTGPYAMKEYVTNSHVDLTLRDDYWGTKPEIKNLHFQVMAESSQVVNALSSGQIDIGRVALSDYKNVSTLPGYNMSDRFIGGGVQMLFGAGHKGFFSYLEKDPQKIRDARYAVIHAIDPQAIIDVCYEGNGKIMHAYAPDNSIDFDPAFNDLNETYKDSYNVELAKQLAQSSGLAGQTITLMTNGQPTMRTLAELIQSMLAEIDVNVEINNTDAGTFQTARYDTEADFDIAVSEGIAPNWRVCDGIVNSVRYSKAQSVPGAFPDNENYLKTAPLTITTADDAQRKEYLLQTLKAFEDNAIAKAFCQYQTSYAVSSNLDMSTVNYNLSSSLMRIKDLKWA